MNMMDKFLGMMKLNGEDSGEYVNDYFDEEDVDDINNTSDVKDKSSKPVETAESPVKKATAKVTSIRQQPRRMNTSGMEVCVIKPDSVEDAREITETLLANRTVVLNLEGIEVEVAQRIIDFTSGSCYAIQGNLQKISHYIFIITPASVDISGDFQEILSGSFDVPSIHN